MRLRIVLYIITIISVALTDNVGATDVVTNDSDSISSEELFISLVKLIGTGDSTSTVSPSHSQPADTSTGGIPLGALDFLSSVYEENTYYDSGFWGKENDQRNSTPFVGYLPDYVANTFFAPVSGKVTSRFGLRSGSNHMHKGVDLSLHRGDTVRVALDGTVERVGYEKGGYGHFIVVSHPDNVQTRYAHLQHPLVERGAELRAGEAVAIGGSSGNSTGPHLHFEVRCQGHPVDPLPLLKNK